MKILVAEDDANISNALCEIFENEGFGTLKAQNGQQALDLYNTENPDFICLDIMMPEINGYDVCRTIRQTNTDIPIIFLSAKDEEIDRVIGLELGADDYITKPFGVREVVARIRAVTRRYMLVNKAASVDDFFTMNGLNIYPQRLKVRYSDNDEDIELSLREVKILELLFNRKNEVIDRDTLLDHCWGEHIMPESRTVDQHISNLRKRIEKDPKNPKIIITVHGAGYKFSPES